MVLIVSIVGLIVAFALGIAVGLTNAPKPQPPPPPPAPRRFGLDQVIALRSALANTFTPGDARVARIVAQLAEMSFTFVEEASAERRACSSQIDTSSEAISLLRSQIATEERIIKDTVARDEDVAGLLATFASAAGDPSVR